MKEKVNSKITNTQAHANKKRTEQNKTKQKSTMAIYYK